MRIRELTIAGFGPYRHEQRVDFDAFTDDGLFLITGKTGAGKSSILDAVCFALYGSIPRFDGTQQKLRSDHCEPGEPTFVQLDFTVRDTDYRVRRSPEYERMKKNGKGLTTSKASAEFSVRSGGEWQARATGPKDVAIEIDSILGLSKDQFLQVILLAQNRFQQFLLAKNEERQHVLRSLFGTRRFEQMEALLVERRRTVELQLGSTQHYLTTQAARMLDLLGAETATDDDDREPAPESPGIAWFETKLEALDDMRVKAGARSEQAGLEFTEAESAHRQLADTLKLQQRRESAETRLAELAEQQADVERQRELLRAASRASSLWPFIVARREAAHAVEKAEAAESNAREIYRDALRGVAENGGEPAGELAPETPPEAVRDAASGAAPETAPNDRNAVTTSAVKARVDETTRALGSLESALDEERRLPALDDEINHLREQRDACDKKVAAVTTRIDELPALLGDIAGRLLAAQVRAATIDSANQQVARLGAQRAAAESVVELAQQHTEALAAVTTASGTNAAAAARVHDLMRQRLDGHAAELAEALIAGEPCAVCGSTEHPRPAPAGVEPVTGDDIDRAHAIAEELGAALDRAHTREKEISGLLTQARAECESKSVEQLDIELEQATLRLADAQSASDEVVGLETQQNELRDELTSAKAELAALRTAAEDASGKLATAEAQKQAIEQRVASMRGGYESIAARVEVLRAVVAAANTLLDAIADTARTRSVLTAAVKSLESQLAGSDFADEEAAERAHREPDDVALIQAQLDEQDAAVAAAKAIIDEPELANLSNDPVPVEQAAEALEAARVARDHAFAVKHSLDERCVTARRVLASARAQHATSAGLKEEFDQLDALASAVQGKGPNTKRMRLETYVLAAQLEEIVEAANTRLRAMSAARYMLQHDDGIQFRNGQSGLGLSILDQHTGRPRSPHSLSGGEMFLASLALALGLAEVVTNQSGGIRLDTLFIDEGFGSLDNDTLEVAMSTLDSLRAGGRTVGLISHVDAMKEQIGAKLHIAVSNSGYSTIENTSAPAMRMPAMGMPAMREAG